MALAMVLTMASFPAFAEEAAATLTVTEATANFGSSATADKAIDGNTSTYFRGSTYHSPSSGIAASNAVYVVFELEEVSTLESFYIHWGQKGAWGIVGPDSYSISVSADGEDYTQIRYYEGLYNAASLETYAGKVLERSGGGTSSYNYSITQETDLGISNVKYIKVQPLSWCERPCLVEFSVTTSPNSTEPATEVEYTVNYVDAEGNALVDAKLGTGVVGSLVTETAPTIDGYKPDAETKSLTLAEGTNEITFTYTPAEAATYTVKYVDEAGNVLSTEKTGEGYEGDEITETAPNLFADGYFVAESSKTVTLAAGENEIVFTYTKVIVPESVSVSYLNGASGWVSGGAGIGNVINGKVGNSTGTYTVNASGATANPVAEWVFTFDKAYAFDTITTYWTTNATVLIYVSDDGQEWGEAVYEDKPATTTVAGLNAAAIDLNGAEGQYVKFVIYNKIYSTIHEFTFEGSEAATEPETPSFAENVTVNGAQIRLPDDGVKAGIRFGATLSPDLVVDVNNFAFDPAGDVKVGMFIIPVDLLGGMTFENYLVANDYEGQALKVVAEHIYERDEIEGITYTAVLTEIPASGYEREITAIPYVCINGEYQFAEQAEAKTYKGVAEAIYADHEAGEITLSQNQLDILAEIIG